jgi:uncharacterized membrane protein YkoI
MKKLPVFAVALGLALMASGYAAWSEENSEQAALVKAMGSAKVSLQQGLIASSKEGKPISAKFEVEDGKLQLSVYTAKDGKFFEVVVNHKTGKITKVVPITEGDDLAHAQSQSAAMTKAKISLKQAVDRARTTAAFRAVSVTPEEKGGHDIASVVLVKGKQFRTLEELLD